MANLLPGKTIYRGRMVRIPDVGRLVSDFASLHLRSREPEMKEPT